MSRRRYCFSLEEKIIKGFRTWIHDKTGDIKKGDLSKWIEIILKEKISQDKQQHQHTTYDQHGMSKDEEMINTLTDLMKDISNYFWKLETPFPFRCGIIIHKKALRKAISAIRGDDPRTPKKWIDRFLDFGFIRKAPNNQYKILNDGHESYDIQAEQEQEQQKEFDDTIEGYK